MPIDAADREIHFERYKLLVNSALETSSRRHSANTYFLTVNTGLFAALGGASAVGLDLLQIGWTFFVMWIDPLLLLAPTDQFICRA